MRKYLTADTLKLLIEHRVNLYDHTAHRILPYHKFIMKPLIEIINMFGDDYSFEIES